MNLHFIEDIKEFYASKPSKRIHDPSEALKQSLHAVCKDHEHLLENPHMTRVCCPLPMYLPKHASKSQREKFEAHRDFCYGVHAGMQGNSGSSKRAHDTVMHQNIIEAIVGEACKDLNFNKDHSKECCTSPGIMLGWSTDNDSVAKACGLARE